MKIKLLSILVVLFGFISAHATEEKIVFSKDGKVWNDESVTGIRQIYELMGELTQTMGTVPPVVERLAIWHFRVDRNEFSPGMARFIRNKVEAILRDYGRRVMISAPELKTTRVIVTDTSFKMSNSLPDEEALWSIGRKLRIDGFVEGSVTRSEEGDVLMNLKIIKQETAEVIWSQSFVAGPNKQDEDLTGYEMGLNLGFSYWPMEEYEDGNLTAPRKKGVTQFLYTAEFRIGEPIIANQRFFISLNMGGGLYLPVLDDPRDSVYNENLDFRLQVQAGPDLTVVFVPKEDARDGYYFGMYAGARAVFPHKFVKAQFGYSSKLSRHLGISAGASWYPIYRTFKPISANVFSSSDYTLKMGVLSYDARVYWAF